MGNLLLEFLRSMTETSCRTSVWHMGTSILQGIFTVALILSFAPPMLATICTSRLDLVHIQASMNPDFFVRPSQRRGMKIS